MKLHPNIVSAVKGTILELQDYTSRKHLKDMRKKIAINVSEFKNPTKLVATIAHELGHVILLGGEKSLMMTTTMSILLI